MTNIIPQGKPRMPEAMLGGGCYDRPVAVVTTLLISAVMVVSKSMEAVSTTAVVFAPLYGYICRERISAKWQK